MLRKNLVSVSSFVLLVAALTAVFLRPAAAGRLPAGRFPNIELTTQDGKKVHFYDDLIKGKIVAIDLIYTTCHYSCPLETARLVQVQKMLGDRMGKDIFFYSITIDPEHDTPEVLKAYAEKYHVGPGWLFLTGKKEEIDFLSKKLGLYSSPAESLDGHTAHLLIGNELTGQWSRTAALDNPRFTAQMIGEVVDDYRHIAAAQPNPGADATRLKFDKGKYLFAKQCAACHTIGHGDKIGPDLLGVTNVRDRQWLVDILQRPEKLLEEKDPLAIALFKKYKEVKMPNLRLDDAQTNVLIDFLVQQSAVNDKEMSKEMSMGTGEAKAPDMAAGHAHHHQ